MIYGHIIKEANRWAITCEARTAKIKRIFPEVSQYASETIHLSDNEENCRDLLWLIDRYVIPWSLNRSIYMQERASFHLEQENLVSNLLQFKQPPENFELAIPPREYQEAWRPRFYMSKRSVGR